MEVKELTESTNNQHPGPIVSDSPWPFVAPLVALLLVPAILAWLWPDPARPVDASTEQPRFDGRALATAAIQILLVGGILGFFRQHYLRVFPWRFRYESIALGIVGVVLWVLLCAPQWENRLLELAGLGGLLPSRPGVNPFESFGSQTVGWFLLLRFTVLTLIVPLAEELFVRGWLVRFLEAQENWDVQPLAQVGWVAQLGVLGYAVLTHPQEAIAAIAWFSLVNWWMKRTGNLWDCVLVHAVTNGLLGAWILYSGDWRLW